MTRKDEWDRAQTGDNTGSKVIYRRLSYQVMNAVFEVHNVLGPGFAESVYEEALAHELQARSIPFDRQKQVTVEYAWTS